MAKPNKIGMVNGKDRDENSGKFLKGNIGGGRPPGTKNFETYWREALEKVAKLNNKTPEELELEIYAKGMTEARAGEFQFYKDTLDRIHGKAIERIAGADGKAIVIQFDPTFNAITRETTPDNSIESEV